MENVKEPASWRFFMNAYTASHLLYLLPGNGFAKVFTFVFLDASTATLHAVQPLDIRQRFVHRVSVVNCSKKITGELTKSEQKTW